ncbi:MAG TPA: SDR family oxidoreductase [Alphaproteobacteria bacterium]|nr:SDR family oxidoreductase [Alphaproteobacteria bacterium]
MNAPSPTAASTRRAALVTGAADRIGAVIAARLAAAGWQVVVHYRSSAAKAKATVARIRAAGGAAAAVRADLASRRERAGLLAGAAEPFGPLTLLVNNASGFARDSVLDLDETLWDAHFAVHVEAPAFLARDFAAQLPDGAEGNIVNIIDARVLDLSPSFFSYTLSKAALWTMTRTLAQSLAPRIRVNAIGPGATLPPPDVTPAAHARRARELPLGRGATPDDIAEGVLHILAMRSMTGQMIALDGGEHIEWRERRGPTPRTTGARRTPRAKKRAT